MPFLLQSLLRIVFSQAFLFLTSKAMESKMEVIVTFLVILELMKVGRVTIEQDNLFDDIIVISNEI